MNRRITRSLLDASAVLSLTAAIAAVAWWLPTRGEWGGRQFVVTTGRLTWVVATSTLGFDATLYSTRPPIVDVGGRLTIERLSHAASVDELAFFPRAPRDFWSGGFGAGAGVAQLWATSDGRPDWRGGPVSPALLRDLANCPPLTAPVAYREAHAPAGAVVVPLLAWPATRAITLAIRWATGRRRLRAGRCVACGYDLRASRERCPECGAGA